MLDGQLFGRVTTVIGSSGLRPHLRVSVIATYTNASASRELPIIVDVLDVSARAYLGWARKGQQVDVGNGAYVGYAQLEGPRGVFISSGSGQTWTFILDTDHPLLRRVEDDRKGRDIMLRLAIDVIGISRQPNSQVPAKVAVGQLYDATTNSMNCTHDIPKSRWLEVLKELGYGEFYMAEIPLPEIRKGKGLDPSIQHLQRAWEHFSNGNDRETLAACYAAFEQLVKQEIAPKSVPDQNAFASLLSGTAHAEKVRRVAQALNHCGAFLHIGRHEQQPPIEVNHRDAEFGLLLTHASLAYVSRSTAFQQRRGKRSGSAKTGAD
jgi:hypothetical protein